MLTLLINLESRPDRLAFMSTQLDRLALPFERIDAVDGSRADLAPVAETLTAVEQACALSHRKAWLRFLETDHARCLILEDDVILAPGLKPFLDEAGNFPDDVGALRLETRFMRTRLGPGRRCRTRGFRLHQLHSTHYGAAAYVVTRAFAEAAARDLAVFTQPVDHVLFGAADACFYPPAAFQLRPALCVQAELVAGVKDASFARSDLEGPRRARLDLLEQAVPQRRVKVKRPVSQKLWREIARWGHKLKRMKGFAHERFVTRRAWREIPFAGPGVPAPAAPLPVPRGEQAL
ncbi:glycosyltransferase family 25 protein [Xanthobacter sp. KR7-65]|uniref:glycosyltransferase family 25 protein n=1 Tax=Xanthobacter sp. KR7-65 TaxID=3156612 RepID=UPI0032B3C92C